MSRKTIPYSQWAGLKIDGAAWVMQGIKEKAAREAKAKQVKLAPSPEPESTDWIERIRKSSAHITTLTMAELRKLPECGEWTAGIYFLWFGEELVYIGKSKCIAQRIIEHENVGRIVFDSHTCLILDIGRTHRPDLSEILQDHERAYIARYPTPHNSRYYTPGT